MATDRSEYALVKQRGQDIMVYVPSHSRLTCGTCGELLLSTTVAAYTRLAPGEPFVPWCVECAYELVRWAHVGAAAAADDASDEA